MQDKIKSFAASGLGIFANGYWGHPAYVLPPEVNLIAVAHYLDALVWQKEIVKIHAVFGGKNPHPNYLVGGVPCSINMNEVAAINSERLNLVSKLIDQADEFVNEVYIPDVLAVASFYKDWAESWRRIDQLPQLRRVSYQGIWPGRSRSSTRAAWCSIAT